jgi:2-(1,2-epoxy-1,2-dihydrophenyl)acetyl-CoA isomerase
VYSQDLVRALWRLDKPTIAALNGVAIQLGLSLALACDFRIASSSASLGSGTLRFGLLPDEGGHWLLLQHLGLSRATEFLMRARVMSAAEALSIGLVNEVVEPDMLMERSMELAVELANGPQTALRLLKASLRAAVSTDLEAAHGDIATRAAISDHDPDVAEGLRAWKERRPARFNRRLESAGSGQEKRTWASADEAGDDG